eukprot:TRINITY_DN212_c0_g2_i1.p1 TRINITY_DN212_c0_g2~~TRINITY_DN212_c0_g2_i1.p1  ORF type:complete len:198 (-),score=54.76 TRINITY_DN212_c0_g2_i1:41-595(-)
MAKPLKLVILGGGAVGKSSVSLQYISGTFADRYDPTIENSYRKQVVIDGKPFQLELIDTAGQEELATMQDQYYQMADGFLVVYSITDDATFKQLETYWSKLVQAQEGNDKPAPIVLIGNKADLEAQRAVPTAKGKEMAKKMGDASFFETSAKTGANVEACFTELVREICRFEEGGKKKEACSIQ